MEECIIIDMLSKNEKILLFYDNSIIFAFGLFEKCKLVTMPKNDEK